MYTNLSSTIIADKSKFIKYASMINIWSDHTPFQKKKKLFVNEGQHKTILSHLLTYINYISGFWNFNPCYLEY